MPFGGVARCIIHRVVNLGGERLARLKDNVHTGRGVAVVEHYAYRQSLLVGVVDQAECYVAAIYKGFEHESR